MNIKLKKFTISAVSSAKTLVVPVFQSANLHASKPLKCLSESSEKLFQILDAKFEKQLSSELKKGEFKAKASEKLSIQVAGKKSVTEVILYGLGAEDDFSDFTILHSAGAVAKKEGLTQVCLKALSDKHIEAACEAVVCGATLSTYEYTELKTKKKDKKEAERSLEILLKSAPNAKAKKGHKLGTVMSRAQNSARDLVNMPANFATPSKLLKTAKRIANSSPRIRAKVLNRAALKKISAGGILGVSQGSSEEAYLIHLTFTPTRKAKKTVCLVGKGITFDSGGLSIKSGSGMMGMKCDMAGAGAVLGVMEAIAKLPSSMQPKHKIHALVPTCENMINGKSIKPGDVIKTVDGSSVEVLNTDAEGRLILADALAYSKSLKADETIDMATLTGACMVALGDNYAGLFSEDEKLTEQLQKSSKKTGEKLWPLPLAKEYRKFLDSEVADIRNIGNPGPGATTAALFLQHFVPKKTAWAHIDIAGPAFPSRSWGLYKKGATGFPVRTIVDYLRN